MLIQTKSDIVNKRGNVRGWVTKKLFLDTALVTSDFGQSLFVPTADQSCGVVGGSYCQKPELVLYKIQKNSLWELPPCDWKILTSGIKPETNITSIYLLHKSYIISPKINNNTTSIQPAELQFEEGMSTRTDCTHIRHCQQTIYYL